ncbi:MAG: DUF3106 domain-containing protein, partial [Gammaproteobacteria bacterium]|nr:DUF3106 domain-containing protein [Gammaproteobacteria bacterium]
MNVKMTYALVATMFLAMASPALAQEQATAWQNLSEAQQKILQPYADDWATISPQRQTRLAAGA